MHPKNCTEHQRSRRLDVSSLSASALRFFWLKFLRGLVVVTPDLTIVTCLFSGGNCFDVFLRLAQYSWPASWVQCCGIAAGLLSRFLSLSVALSEASSCPGELPSGPFIGSGVCFGVAMVFSVGFLTRADCIAPTERSENSRNFSLLSGVWPLRLVA